MTKLKFFIRKNKANNQINLSPRKREMPKELLKKFDSSKWLEIDEKDLFLKGS